MLSKLMIPAFGILGTLVPTLASASIGSYKTIQEICSVDGTRIAVIRSFTQNGQPKLLSVNPNSLETKILSASAATDCNPAGSALAQTRYGDLLAKAQTNESSRSNSGVTHALDSQALFLTVDLCPSTRPFERAFFDWVRTHKTPMALSVSGTWLTRHSSELNTLKNLGTEIVWVNHTLTHPYNQHLPDEHNFLLLPGVNVENEILGNEKVMIENGLTPSIFLRFPGLISDREIAAQVNSWGLVALGADAWLALGQNAKPGSIILVHGNGNEAPGIRLFMNRASQFLKTGFASLRALAGQ